ncbi:MAG: hypothetical protein WDM76_08675 [Limisphaerales bacterium]
MKTRILLTILGAAALAAITTNVNAGSALLSPRASSIEIKHVSGVANDPNLVSLNTGRFVSPRASSIEIKRVSGVASVAAAKCPVLGSPKYVELAGKSARTSCCGLTVAECPTMDKMN